MNVRKKYLLAVVASLIIVFCTLYLDVVEDTSFSFKPKVTCGRFPTKKDISIDNEIWQVVKAPNNKSLFLLKAYYDGRRDKTVVINMVTYVWLNVPVEKMFCQFWFEKESQPIVVQALRMKAALDVGDFMVLTLTQIYRNH